MKNLVIYINQDKQFFGIEDNLMVQTQIENSLELGWKAEDILLVTNFPYEFSNIKSRVLEDDCYCIWWKQTSKINGIVRMFEKNLIEPDQIYWLHDLDAFENYPVEMDLEGKDTAFTDYGYDYRLWNTGSFFFNSKSRDIFEMIKKRCYEIEKNEERVLEHFTNNNVGNINSRIKRINITYNFPGSNNGNKYFQKVWDVCEKPVKVLHFHPLRWEGRFYRMMNGGNPLGVKLMSERLQRRSLLKPTEEQRLWILSVM